MFELKFSVTKQIHSNYLAVFSFYQLKNNIANTEVIKKNSRMSSIMQIIQ